MGMTITEKILADHAGLNRVEPGELVNVKVDLVMGTDVTVPLAGAVFEKMGAKRVFDPERVVFVNDHFVPAKDIQSAELSKSMRAFAQKYGIVHFFEVGRSGICHSLMPEQGLVVPGDVLIGADSHTCTAGAVGAFATGVGSTDMAAAMALGEIWLRVPESLKVVFSGRPQRYVYGKDLVLRLLKEVGVDGARYMAIEYSGDTMKYLQMSDRFSLCNMAVEAGGKSGIVAVDEVTEKYLEGRAKRPYKIYRSDPDARYARALEIDVSKLEPQVACPFSPDNVRSVDELVKEKIKVDQVFIGSCTNGTIEDMRIAASVLRGRKAADNVRLIVIPATASVHLQSVKEGLAEIFIEAGAAFSTSTCGPCLGGHMGVLGAGERAITTTSRNFRGRMGHVSAEAYLANPAVAAASAVLGRIADPRELE